MAGKITRRWTTHEFFGGVRQPTHDDVPVAVDGRVLDTPEKLIAYLDEINERRADSLSSG